MTNVYRTSLEDIKAYRNHPGVSQSYLKDLDCHLDAYLSKPERKETLSMIKGSAVDCILTGQEGDFEKTYYISDLDFTLSEVEKSIIDLTFSLIINAKQEVRNLDDHLIALDNAIRSLEWYKGNPGEKRINTLVGEARGYFEELKLSQNKTILKRETYNEIEKVVNSLRTNVLTKDYFVPENNPSKNVDIYYQLPIFFMEGDLECKALLDMLIIIKNEDNEVLSALVVDLKTTEMFTLDFLNSVQSFRYDIQAAFYSSAVRSFIFETYPSETYVTDVVPFSIDFQFIVESFKKQNPLIFKTTPEFITTGMWGYKTPYKTVRGYKDLLSLHLYYSNNEWKQDKIIAENDSVLTLTFDNGFKIYED